MIVNRYDIAMGEQLTLPATFHEDGTITAKSIITSIGVFSYRKPDGTIQRELRTPEVVFDSAFIESVKNMPIYVDHKRNPDGSLIKDAEQRNAVTVGRVDSNVEGNNVYLAAGLKIDRADGARAVLAGHNKLSVGYVCKVTKESGVWCGVQYDAVQTELRADHLALVTAGRQGDQAAIRMDSADDAIMVETPLVKEDENNIDTKEANMPTLKKIVLDSIDYEAEEAVIKALNAEKTRADAAEKVIADGKIAMQSVEAARDTFKDRADALEKELVAVKAQHLDTAAIEAGVTKKIALLKAAEKAGVELKGDESDVEIQKAVIMRAFPAAKLDGRDETYLAGRFDGALEFLDSKVDATVRAAGVSTVKVDEAITSGSARDRYIERLKTQHKAEK